MNTVYELDTRTLLAVFIVIQLLLALVAIRATQDYGKPYAKIYFTHILKQNYCILAIIRGS